MWGKDLRRSVDYLETRDDIDHERLAYLGLSWGAAMAPIMIAVEPRIKAGIVVVAGLNFQTSLPEVDELHYISRVRVPMLMLNGRYDFFFPYETSQLPYFELLGTPEAHKKIMARHLSRPGPIAHPGATNHRSHDVSANNHQLRETRAGWHLSRRGRSRVQEPARQPRCPDPTSKMTHQHM